MNIKFLLILINITAFINSADNLKITKSPDGAYNAHKPGVCKRIIFIKNRYELHKGDSNGKWSKETEDQEKLENIFNKYKFLYEQQQKNLNNN